MVRTLIMSLVLLRCAVAAAGGGVAIVVNRGEYPSAEKAAAGEADVNWRDADATDDTICTECFAAVELRHYLCKMAGLDEGSVPIADDEAAPEGDLLVVGNPGSNRAAKELWKKAGLKEDDLAGLGRDGFIIKSTKADGRRLVLIAGAERVGTLYGVYDFLERLGVRWTAPGESNEYVPRKDLDDIPDMDVRERPAFFTRGFWAWEDRGNDEFLDWMARNKMNLWTDAQSNHPALKKRGLMLTCGGHLHQSRFLGPHSEYPYNHPRFKGDEDKPDDPYPVSEDFRGDADGDGKLEYCEAHPEWYGLRGGRRSFNIRGDGGDNFCTSNKYACDELMKNLVQDLIDGEWKDADSVDFWTLDCGKWCECEKCKALGTPTDRNLLLVHRLRAEIKKAMKEGRLNRNVQIAFLAYADVIAPPTRPLPRDFDYENCIATFFPIGRCYVHALADPKCTTNGRYIERYKGWAIDPKRHYKGQIFIGEYYNVSGFKCLPAIYFHTMSADIPYYYRTGARHMHYMHCTTKNWGPKALTNYQMAKMLWNPSTDVQALFDDYLECRYGPAKETMRRFYRELEQAFLNIRELRYGLAARLDRGDKRLFTSKHLQYEEQHPPTDDGPDFVEIMRHIDSARDLIERARKEDLPPGPKARIAEDYAALMYGWNTLHFYDHMIRAVLLKREGKLAGATDEFRKAAALAKILREDRESAAYSSSHASARNAFAASRIAGAYQRLEMELGPGDPSRIKTFDPSKGRLVIYGVEFIGGGQGLYHPGFRAGGKWVSTKGNYLYARQEKPYCMMAVLFKLERVPAKARLVLAGMSCPEQRGTIVPIRVALNGQTIFEGEGPFPEGKLSIQEYEIKPGLLKEGMNRLTIENLLKMGRRGRRPWFGVDRIEIVAGSGGDD